MRFACCARQLFAQSAVASSQTLCCSFHTLLQVSICTASLQQALQRCHQHLHVGIAYLQSRAEIARTRLLPLCFATLWARMMRTEQVLIVNFVALSM